MARSKLSLQQRIESHIVSKDDCWLTDLCCPSGYPRFSVNGKMKQLSHIIYQLYNGEIPEGFIICHKCDNPACISPNHLFLGTPKEFTRHGEKRSFT